MRTHFQNFMVTPSFEPVPHPHGFHSPLVMLEVSQ